MTQDKGQVPEALRLAAELDETPDFAVDPNMVDDLAAELRRQHARIAELEAQLESIGAGGVSGPLIGQPQAMPDLSQLTERGAKAWAGVDAQELRESFTAADMASAAAQGFRDGVASLSLPAAGQEPVAQWQKRHPVRTDGQWENTHEHDAKWWLANSQGWEVRALYAAPQPALSAGWVSLSGALPKPGTPVLLDIGNKYPIRAQWVPKDSLEATGDGDFGEYNEASDMYYWPEGWYEWNQYEETHWRVDETPRAWQPLPASPTIEGESNGAQ